MRRKSKNKRNNKKIKIEASLYGISVVLVGSNIFYSCNSQKEGAPYKEQIKKVISQLRGCCKSMSHVDNHT